MTSDRSLVIVMHSFDSSSLLQAVQPRKVEPPPEYDYTDLPTYDLQRCLQKFSKIQSLDLSSYERLDPETVRQAQIPASLQELFIGPYEANNLVNAHLTNNVRFNLGLPKH